MNNQKDTQKTDLNSYGQTTVSNDKSLIHNHVYDFANKKTEKLVTALYMVTDCMDTDDALKGKLRSLGVQLLSDMYTLATVSSTDKRSRISASLARIHEVLSFVEIASTIGYISDMNTSILKKEFLALITELKSYQVKDKHFTFTLDEQMFEIKNSPVLTEEGVGGGDLIKDNIKRTTFNNMSFKKENNNLSLTQPKRHSIGQSIVDKEDRTNKIISLIKTSSNGHDGVSIKDISIAFADCSEKTIQRELNSLVSNGKIKKIGAKRWSRYHIL